MKNSEEPDWRGFASLELFNRLKERWKSKAVFYNDYVEDDAQPIIDQRDQIFVCDDKGVGEHRNAVFRKPGWKKVIIRGGIHGTDRSEEPDDDFEYWRNDDPRDELAPLMEVLKEEGVEEVIQTIDDCFSDPDHGYMAYGCAPDLKLIRGYDNPEGLKYLLVLDGRVMFDRSGRWGLYLSEENFGLLGGEPDLIDRYAEKAGGWKFVREKADEYWGRVASDMENWEHDRVQKYYQLAGWDNPPLPNSETTNT